MTRLQALPLYPYQEQGLAALTGKARELIALPTGGGKTVMFAHLALRHQGGRMLVLVHTDELVSQAHKRIVDVAPHLEVGIVKAERNECTAQVIVASVQTLRNPIRRAQVENVTLIVVDEAHHAVAATYQAILDHYPHAQKVGFTATPERGDGKSLYPTWERIAFQRDIGWMVRKQYLVPPRGLAVEVPDLDLANVKSTRTDYRDGELGEALAESLAPELVAKAYLEHAAGRRALLFAPTVASAEVFRDAMLDAGVGAEVIHGAMALEDRRKILVAHKRGDFPVLCNCMILTEGYDDPKVSCIIVARPTKSRPLYIQIAGRGLRRDLTRPYEGQDCLLLDVVGAGSLGLRSIADLSTKAIKDEHSGRTLIELEDEFDAGEGVGADQPVYYTGPVEVTEFDPLAAQSSKVWIRTKAGAFYVPAGREWYVMICEWPEPGLYSVAQVPVRWGKPTMTEHRSLPLEQAMVWAEDLAVDLGTDLNTMDKKASWRKGKPSEKTVALAGTLGISVEGKRAGQVSDEIGVVLASRRLDPLVMALKQRSNA
jgi:superfamily II DNA or RNA helicase